MNQTKTQRSGIDLSTLAGLAAVLIWAMVPAVKRLLAESLSMFLAGSMESLIGGLILYLLKRKSGGCRPLRGSNPRYWLLCALPFLLYTVFGTLSVGLSATREGAVIASLVRSLWPLSTLALTVPILGARTSRAFPLTLLLGIAGVVLANCADGLGSLLAAFRQNTAAILFGLLTAVCWGIYSDFYCLIVRDPRDDYMPLLAAGVGLLQLLAGALTGERIQNFGVVEVAGLAFEILLSTVCANLFWNLSMRGDSRMTVILFSNLTPVLSTLFSCLILGVPLSTAVIAGAALVVLSTFLSKLCLLPQERAAKTLKE